MTPSLFANAMQSIGSSLKGILQESRITQIFHRPVIGQLGIGLMALTQVCGEAEIESQSAGSDTKFVARLDFSDFRTRKQKQTEIAKIDIFRELAASYGGIGAMQEKLASLAPDSDEYAELRQRLELASEADRSFTERGAEDLEGEHLGYCVIYPDVPAVRGQQGTTITLRKIDEGVRAALMDRGRSPDALPESYKEWGWERYRREVNQWSWDELCQRLQKRTTQLSYQSLPRYHQFLWELSIMTPVQYLDKGPVLLDPALLRSKKDELDAFHFSVLVDNRSLSKPILLPSGSIAREEKLEEEYDYNLWTLNQDERVDEHQLKYAGYIFWQRKQVEPSSLRGIQIYIRNVGIGLYDQTLMGFSTVNPTSRAGQISGEIYVEEGLEQALNVDRNSFRETDAHYLALQEYVWKLIGSATRGNGVMGMSVDSYWKRRERREEQGLREHIQNLRERVKLASNGNLVLVFSEEDNRQPYIIGEGRITVYNGSPRWPRAIKERRLCQQLLVPAKAAAASGASVEQVLASLEKSLLKR
jgi:hypothetical protein